MPTHHANGTLLPERMTYLGVSVGGYGVSIGGGGGVSVSIGDKSYSTDDIDVDPFDLLKDGCTTVGCIKGVIGDEFEKLVEDFLESIAGIPCKQKLLPWDDSTGIDLGPVCEPIKNLLLSFVKGDFAKPDFYAKLWASVGSVATLWWSNVKSSANNASMKKMIEQAIMNPCPTNEIAMTDGTFFQCVMTRGRELMTAIIADLKVYDSTEAGIGLGKLLDQLDSHLMEPLVCQYAQGQGWDDDVWKHPSKGGTCKYVGWTSDRRLEEIDEIYDQVKGFLPDACGCGTWGPTA